jgi:hypothetical protein
MAASTLAHRTYRGRPVRVPRDLADLHGPTTGTLTLPLWVYWSGAREWKLDSPVDLRELYRTVVREAKKPGDLDYLDGATLVALWPDLCRRGLPSQVRAAWEDQHPALAAARLPAAS